MSFMDKLNATAQKKMQTAVPKSSVAKNAIVNNTYKNGKSSVQGANGVGQANQGWKSQYTGAGEGYKKQINPIINSLSQAPTYQAPKITDSLLTNEGFNQALGVVGARNNAKLKSQNQRVLQGVLGSLVNGDTQNRAIDSRHDIAGMNDATRRRGQDFAAEAKANALEEAKVRDKTLKRYYEGQNAIGEGRNSIARYKIENPTSKQINPIDAQKKRLDIVNKVSDFGAYAGIKDFDNLSEEQQKSIKGRFVSDGAIPNIEKVNDDWFNDNYSVVYGDNTQKQQANTPSEQPKIATGKLFDALAKKYKVDRGEFKLSDDGKSILFPDGGKSPLENVQRGLGL